MYAWNNIPQKLGACNMIKHSNYPFLFPKKYQITGLSRKLTSSVFIGTIGISWYYPNQEKWDNYANNIE
jgi:hypothetical protein